MNRIGFYFTLFSGVTGFILFLPKQILAWEIYSFILTLHILANFSLIGFILVILFSHIRKVYRMNRNRIKKWNGIGYLIAILLSITSGLLLGYTSALANVWILPLHLIAGVWTIIFAMQHVKPKLFKRNSITQNITEKEVAP